MGEKKLDDLVSDFILVIDSAEGLGLELEGDSTDTTIENPESVPELEGDITDTLIENPESGSESDELDDAVELETFKFERQGDWVAVAYEEAFFVGQVIEVYNNNCGMVQFLNQGYQKVFRWPKVDDTAETESKFVFSSNFECVLQHNGRTWRIPEINQITKSYEQYKQKIFVD